MKPGCNVLKQSQFFTLMEIMLTAILSISYSSTVSAHPFPVVSANGFKCSVTKKDLNIVECEGSFSDDPDKSMIRLTGSDFVKIEVLKNLESDVAATFVFDSASGCVRVGKIDLNSLSREMDDGKVPYESFKIKTAKGKEHNFKNVSNTKSNKLFERYCTTY